MKPAAIKPANRNYFTLKFVLLIACSGALVAALASRVAGFAALAPLGTPRAQHTATLLNNGKVLIAGGSQAGVMSSMNSVELYDPVANAFTAAASMSGERRSHTATLLGDGRVLVAGGYVGMLSYALNTVEIYDPATNTWTAAASFSTPRGNHTATLLSNGKVLIAGGAASDLTGEPTNTSALSTAEIYDPATNTWNGAGSLIQARHHHTATVLGSGQVLVTGGTISNGAVTLSTEMYDPLANAWFQMASMKTARSHHTATMMSNGQLMVAGGWVSGTIFLSSTEIYSPGTNTWDDGAGMGSTRALHTATLLGDGRILVTGGSNGAVLKCSELYDPAAKMWMLAGELMFPRVEHTATLLTNGKVFIAGGNSEKAETELYDESANQAPGILSGPTAAPNPGTSGNPVAFTVVAADPDKDPLTYTWEFGDGASETSGPNTSHTYAAAGMYTAKVSVSDGVNAPVSDTVVVTVNQALLLTIAKAQVKLNFSRIDADAISFSGALELPAMFVPQNAKISFDIGGVTRTLMLNAKGTGSDPYNSVKIKLPKNPSSTLPTPAAFSATFKKGNFSASLARSGLLNADIGRSIVTVPFKITLNGAILNASKTLSYTGKFRKWGAAK